MYVCLDVMDSSIIRCHFLVSVSLKIISLSIVKAHNLHFLFYPLLQQNRGGHIYLIIDTFQNNADYDHLETCYIDPCFKRHHQPSIRVADPDPVFLHGWLSNFSGSGSGFQFFWIRTWIRFQPRFWKIAERSQKVIYQKKT